jgi:hypothetical protein
LDAPPLSKPHIVFGARQIHCVRDAVVFVAAVCRRSSSLSVAALAPAAVVRLGCVGSLLPPTRPRAGGPPDTHSPRPRERAPRSGPGRVRPESRRGAPREHAHAAPPRRHRRQQHHRAAGTPIVRCAPVGRRFLLRTGSVRACGRAAFTHHSKRRSSGGVFCGVDLLFAIFCRRRH